MKTFLRISGVGILLMLPGISAASTADLLQSGDGGNMTSYFYRSYDCRVGSLPVTITTNVVVPPSNNTGNTNNPNTNSDSTTLTDPTTPSNPDVIIIPPDNGDSTTTSVPAPASSQMAGAGLALVTAFSWLRARKPARA